MRGRHPEKSRAGDLRELEILHLLDHEHWRRAANLFGMSRSAIYGLANRTKGAADKVACHCRKAENRDGGMQPRWWAS